MEPAANIFRSPTASLFVGKLGQVATHVHRWAALVLPLDGPIRLSSEQGSQSCLGAWVPPRFAHRLDCAERQVAVLYLDPLRYGTVVQGAPRFARVRERWAELALQNLTSTLPKLLRTGDLASTEAHCAEELLPRVGVPVPTRTALARDVRDVLRAIPIQELDLERAAHALALSPSRFSHLFSQRFGVSWTAYRNWQRLMQVSAELCRAPASITELAHAWGFSSHAHLSASLRGGFGITPSQLRALRPKLHTR